MSNSQNKKNEQQNNLCITLTEQWKKGELPRGYYYAEDNGEELIIHIQEKNGSVMGDDFNLEATDWIKPIAPVPSYEEWRDTENRSLLATEFSNEIDELNEENQQLKELLKECRKKSFEIRLALSSGKINDVFVLTYQIENKIDNAIGEK